jgi:hypothetical protein
MRGYSIVAGMVVGLLAIGTPGAAAQSPSPSTVLASPAPSSSEAPTGSTLPATDQLTCDDLAGLLPRSLSAYPLLWSATEGAAEPVPGYPVATLAASLGITPADVCTVTFEYGSTVNGSIVRFHGAEQAGLLNAYIEDVRATTAAKGFSLLTQPLDLAGRPAIEVGRDGFDRTAWQLEDMIFEMPTGPAAQVSAALPSVGATLPQVSPPPPGATEPPVMAALKDCGKLWNLIQDGFGLEHLSGSSGFGPDVIDRSGTLEDPGTSPAIMSDGLFDRLGISPYDVCLQRVDYGDTVISSAHLWKLGKGVPGTLQAYLDDVTATVEAKGGTVERGTTKLAKHDLTTLTVTLPTGITTFYYEPLGTVFAEFPSKEDAQRIVPLLKAAKK